MASRIGGHLDLLAAAAATGTSMLWDGSSRAALFIWGTWDGATAKLQVTPDKGTTWIDVDGTSLTANGGVRVELPPLAVRVAISGAGASASLSATLRGLD